MSSTSRGFVPQCEKKEPEETEFPSLGRLRMAILSAAPAFDRDPAADLDAGIGARNVDEAGTVGAAPLGCLGRP